MDTKKIIIAIVAIIAVVAIGLWATGSLGTNTSLEGQEVHISAAASLKNVFEKELIPKFEAKYPGVKIVPTYGSSGDLQSQIENGLETDIFVSASNKQMNALAKEGFINNDTNVQMLENKVVLIVPKDSNLNISSFEDLKNVNGTIAIGDPESVPAGQYAKEVLTNLGIWDILESKLSYGTDATSVLNQVAQGSADCGIVYATDAQSNPDVKVVCEAPADSLNTSVIYPIAMTNGTHSDAAKLFFDFLQSKEAKDIFTQYGFTIVE